ncbi:MAG TPA: MaoC/PaaZ C-terminal domain-containing protein [Anaerolineales bacterium]|nr:MaoC/PaaZ C-terminal domain-containing protein [Anaerolineales bacterium]HMV97239.1 MaoC/PaaZ C-terminal domain-containing protein [Anaerolineales bacterium]HMX18243.1 MaoC/PaaZ C-terminal domain-containing protein [Anaerolineales bacterium]HMX75588.1 MaoC/PaaZ C-terminal domain-containing protein [Anaerolineales bacterium]HMZ44328.1 MaoC/PaaZ C-terminal domain-containing protein [Anaerolineales bacterium]
MAGLYFEEFSVGQKFNTVGRTVSEGDIFNFAGLTGDFNQIHTDAAFAAKTQFGQRIAHGLLGLSLATGLIMRTGLLEGTVLAFREINEWKFVKPFYIGDTIYAELTVTETKALPRIGGGALISAIAVKNQSDEICQRGSLNLLVLSKPK